jgi:hypothetical protein
MDRPKLSADRIDQWREGQPLPYPVIYYTHADDRPVRCKTTGDLLVAIALDEGRPVAVDVVDAGVDR